VARKTISAGIAPRRRGRKRQHVIGIIVFDGVVLADVAAPAEVFARARGKNGPLYDLRICSANREVQTAHLTLGVPWRLKAIDDVDTLIIPGLDDLDRPIPDTVIRAIRRADDRGIRLASICTGAFVLAASGALDGKNATTHWLAAGELARRHPRVHVEPSVLYVDNGRVLTSAGAAAAFDLCLHIIRRDHGAAVAADVARAAVMPLEREGGQAQFIAHAHQPTMEEASTVFFNGPTRTWARICPWIRWRAALP
jgi:transcriptional regulator GlxA family with amidase domain